MCPGHKNDPQQISDSRKVAIIDLELSKLDIDMTALQESRLAEDGMWRPEIYTFFWQDHTESPGYTMYALQLETVCCIWICLPMVVMNVTSHLASRHPLES